MLDAIPAAHANARAVPIDPPKKTATSDFSHAGALLHAARSLLPILVAGRTLDAATLRESMTAAFGATDASGAWQWKDAYEACEAAMVLFLRRYGRAMRKRAGAGSDGQRKMLAMLSALAALEPSHTRRSEEQVRLQQFSTPLPLAYVALQAAAIRPGDIVLEPSAGTGMLAVMAACALGRGVGGLHLNEIALARAELLAELFGEIFVTHHNAETIADFLPKVRPTAVLMNPPFSASPGVAQKKRLDADLRHLRSAFSMMLPGGRLVAITSANCVPGNLAWDAAMASLSPRPKIVFSMAVDGRVYARRGTSFATRLTVLDREDTPDAKFDSREVAANVESLLDAVLARVPPRLPVGSGGAAPKGTARPEPKPALAPAPHNLPLAQSRDLADEPAADLFGAVPDSRQSGKRRKTGSACNRKNARSEDQGDEPRTQRELGPVVTLDIQGADANGRATGPNSGSDSASVSDPDPDPASASRDATVPDAGPHTVWQPSVVRVLGAVPHPTPLVQSAAMAAVPHPVPSHRPMLPARVVTEGLLSDAQLESVVLAGESHAHRLTAEFRVGADWETVLRCGSDGEVGTTETADGETLSAPVRFRRGWMLGDGTGTGKGRQVAGMILDNWLQNRRRALWMSQSDKLVEDARRDWTALGGCDEDVIPLKAFRQGAEIPQNEGILFATYATLRAPARQGRVSRLEQIVRWLAGSLDEAERHAFGGVIVFDEAHAMANAGGSIGTRGKIAPSQQGRAGLRLQHALPDARVVYVSATGATTVPGLAYAVRLGLWGAQKTPFETRADFVAAMEAGGVAALEVVARDLKALGLYQARALSYAGVEVDILEHPLSPAQRRIFDAWAGAFRVIHQNIEKALEATGAVEGGKTLNRNAKSAAVSAFEGAKQRFFGHLLTSMKCPSLIRAVEDDLAHERAAVIQLVSTGESLMERRLADIPPSEWDDISVDLTPRDSVIEYLNHAFPVQLQEPFTDEDGNLLSRPVRDADGNPVLSQEALARREALIEKLVALPAAPAALDQILHHFGEEAVAEVTGRSRRVLRIVDSNGERFALRSRPASANLVETAAFMDGQKNILVFSQAGGTGRSYHADLSCANTRRRVHYLLEAGWRADQAIQGLGRTHRTHQAHPPRFRPVTTDVKGERRFIATIARRLDSLGAITRGQRDSQTAMDGGRSLFRTSDNLESPLARAALRQFYAALWGGHIQNWSLDRFETATGLNLSHDGALKEELPPMSRFLNRLLALPIGEQNELFADLEARVASNIEQAMEAGTFETGVETVRADSLVVTGRETLQAGGGGAGAVGAAGASGAATELVEIRRKDRLQPLLAQKALELSARDSGAGGSPRLLVNDRSGRAAAAVSAPSRMLEDGGIVQRLCLLRPDAREVLSKDEFARSRWRTATETEWRQRWDAEVADLPKHRESRFWLATGLLLPVWDRLPAENLRVRRLTTDSGEALIGRMLDIDQVRTVRGNFGLLGGFAPTAEEAFSGALERGAAQPLANGWRITRRRVFGTPRVEIDGPADTDLPALKRFGCAVEIIAYRARVFVPDAAVLSRVFQRWPAAS